MKSAKFFLAGMYIHLLFSFAAPIIFAKGGFTIVFPYLAAACFVHVVGWICVRRAKSAHDAQEYNQLQKSLILLKFASIPFYILNFIYSVIAWFFIALATMGALWILRPLPVIFTCLMIVQSGCIGIFYIMLLRKLPGIKISRIHYVLQLIPVIDVISTIIVLLKSRNHPIPADVNTI